VKLDAFCHVLPKRYFDRLQQSSSDQAANLLKRTAPIRSLWDVGERLRVIEPFDEYAQIISLAPVWRTTRWRSWCAPGRTPSSASSPACR